MESSENKYRITLGNLYELNRQAMATHPLMKDSAIEKIKPNLEDWFNDTIDGYAMLLCRERYDFTVFHLYEKANPHPQKVATTEFIQLLKERGKILSIEKDSNIINNAWEIWLKIGDEAFAYYLFKCDEWVIEC